MSFVQRRRFLWILFLARWHCLPWWRARPASRLRFEELAQQRGGAAACLGGSTLGKREIWTDTRFEVVEQNKACSGTGHDSNGWRNDRQPAFASGRSAGFRGRRSYVFSEREGEPHAFSLVAGDVSHCERCTDGVETVTKIPGCTGV